MFRNPRSLGTIYYQIPSLVPLEMRKVQVRKGVIDAYRQPGPNISRSFVSLTSFADTPCLSQEQAGLEARKVGLDTKRNALQAFLSNELRIIENASRVRTYLQSEDRSVVISMIESFVKKVELKNGSVTIHYSIPMPPGGNGKKVGSETLPLNGDQWPMETPASAPASARGSKASRRVMNSANSRKGR